MACFVLDGISELFLAKRERGSCTYARCEGLGCCIVAANFSQVKGAIDAVGGLL